VQSWRQDLSSFICAGPNFRVAGLLHAYAKDAVHIIRGDGRELNVASTAASNYMLQLPVK